MKTYSLFDKPIRVYGVPFFERDRKLVRLSDAVIEELPHLNRQGRRCSGGRLAFKTNSPSFTVRITLESLILACDCSLYAGQSAAVMLGERAQARHVGMVSPPGYQTHTFEKTFTKSTDMEQVTVYFPRLDHIEQIEIDVTDTSIVLAPTPYRQAKPIVFYGSSITEGASAGNAANSYQAILSRWLDFDYINMGFAGNAKGELIMADYISTMDMSAFVLDYDHNAPTAAHLAQTHKPFFDCIRKAHPDIPILMMTRPAEIYTEDIKARREVVKATFDAARAAGDTKVYFIDGETFYGESDRNLCSADNCHSNDLGFFRMASIIRPVMREILKSIQ